MSTTISKKSRHRVEKSPLGTRVEPAVKEALERAAEREKRSLTAQVEIILGEWLKAQEMRK